MKRARLYFKIAAATLAVTIPILVWLAAGLLAISVTIPLQHSVCCESPADFGANFERMEFQTTDGITLTGWFVPADENSDPSSPNAVIILIHSYHSDRRQTLPVAGMLHKHGYGLLMYDQRASGESQGDSRSLGWRDTSDLAAAAGWLKTRMENVQIGVYGCSMGGAIALAGSADLPSIQAAVVDAPSPLQWYENLPRPSLRDPLSLPIMALYYPTVMLRARVQPPMSTQAAVQRFGLRPVLFISSGTGAEFERVETYFQAANGPKEHWNIPDSQHCGGPKDHPKEYEMQLVSFFDINLR